MSYRFKAAAAALCVAAASGLSQADVILGDFEGAAETGWGRWAGGVQPFAAHMTISSEAATLGSSSMKIVKSGLEQNLAYSAGAAGTTAAFAAHDTLLFDVVFPATADAGWAQIYEVVINSPTPAGWAGINLSAERAGWGAGGGDAIVKTFEYDYRHLKANWAGTPGYLELIFTTNSDTAHGVFYIDNVRLAVVPEPATLASLAAGAGLALRRRRV